MSKVFLSILFLVIGLVIGGAAGVIGGGAAALGSGAGIGIATGLSAGVCGTVEAARGEGFVTDDEVGRLFDAALAESRALAPQAEADAEAMVLSFDECAEVLERLREAAAE
jgi:hypothetical protein